MHPASHIDDHGASGHLPHLSTPPAASPSRVDHREAPREATKIGIVGGEAGQLAWRVCRDLVRAATSGWRGGGACNRRAIAVLLRSTEGVVNRKMSPSDDLNFRADDLHALMTSERVPAEARARAAGVLARAWGFVLSPAGTPGREAAGPDGAALGLASAAGRTAGLVHGAMADGRIDAEERDEISAAAMDAQHQAGAVITSVEGRR